MEIRYGKLVRDSIPEAILREGFMPDVRTLSQGEYLSELRRKLTEEVAESLESGGPEEPADIPEVVYAPGKAQRESAQRLDAVRREKRSERGGFSKRLYLKFKTRRGYRRKERFISVLSNKKCITCREC